jgi:hypothetical protein
MTNEMIGKSLLFSSYDPAGRLVLYLYTSESSKGLLHSYTASLPHTVAIIPTHGDHASIEAQAEVGRHDWSFAVIFMQKPFCCSRSP